MSASNAILGKSKARSTPHPASAPTAKALTVAWQKRVKNISLNRPGQKRLTLHQLNAEGYN